MAIDNFNIVDYANVRNDKVFELRIYDSYFWDDEELHIETLLEKIDLYIMYIDCGEMHENLPLSTDKEILICIMFAQKPTANIINNLQKVSETLVEYRILLETVYTENIIYSSNYDFTKDHNISRVGDSGEIYLAANQQDINNKYLVKHSYSEDACNEYVYSKLANKLGIKTPNVKLIIPTNNKVEFKDSHICGIEWIETLKKDINPNNLSENNIHNRNDYYKFIALYGLLLDDDSFEVILGANGYIYKVDNSSSFDIGLLTLPPRINMTNDMTQITEDEYKDHLHTYYGSNGKLGLKTKYDFWCNSIPSEYLYIIENTVRDFSLLDKDCIDSDLDDLKYLYSEKLKNYYKIFIMYMIDETCKLFEYIGNKKANTIP